MKKLFTLAFLCVSLSAFSQPKYVGRFFGDGAGLTNMPITGLKNYGNIVTNQVPLTAGLPVVGDGGSGVIPTNNLTVATATAQQFLISGVSNKVAVFQSNGLMVGTNTVHISGQFIADTAPGFIGGGSSISNISMAGLQGSGGSGTAGTNGTFGQRWTSSGNGGGYWSDTGHAAISTGTGLIEEFYTLDPGTTGGGTLGIIRAAVGGGAVSKVTATNTIGVLRLASGTSTSTDYVSLKSGGTINLSEFLPAQTWTNEWRFKLVSTPTLADGYQIAIGLGSANAVLPGVEASQALYLKAPTNSATFTIYRAAGAGGVTIDTGIVYQTNVWYKFSLGIVGSSNIYCAVYTNATQGITTNFNTTIPTGNLIPFMTVSKGGGSTSQTADIDYWWSEFVLQNPR